MKTSYRLHLRPAGAALAAALLCAGCGRDAQGEFTAERALDPCVQQIPACPSVYGRCALDSWRFASVLFPAESPFRFVVSAAAGDTIEVRLFFVREQAAGIDTSIAWYEPGCSDVDLWESGGKNLLDEAQADGWVSRQSTVREDGDHLIEIFSDIEAEVLVAVALHEGGS